MTNNAVMLSMSSHYLGASLPDLVFGDNAGSPGQSPAHAGDAGSAAVPPETIPDEKECRALWDKYAVPDHIRRHCMLVADIATAIAVTAHEQGVDISPAQVRSAGLLHDIGKDYCIRYGGSHAQLGAAWMVRETRNHAIGQAILHHVYWPFEPNVYEDSWLMALLIVYADKRVKHDRQVSLAERFDDLVDRYGTTPLIIERIGFSHQQGVFLENSLSQRFGVKLNECSFDSGRLV